MVPFPTIMVLRLAALRRGRRSSVIKPTHIIDRTVLHENAKTQLPLNCLKLSVYEYLLTLKLSSDVRGKKNYEIFSPIQA